jgi:DNA-binding PadR family transcriptional regulator
MMNYPNQGLASLPRVLQAALRALSSPNRQKIALEISLTDQLTFTGLLERTELNKGTLYRDLAELENGGIVVNYYQKLGDKKVYSFYELTPFGKSILTSLVSVVRGKGIESQPSLTVSAIEPAYNLFDAEELPTSDRLHVPRAREGSTTSEDHIPGGAGDSNRAATTSGGLK